MINNRPGFAEYLLNRDTKPKKEGKFNLEQLLRCLSVYEFQILFYRDTFYPKTETTVIMKEASCKKFYKKMFNFNSVVVNSCLCLFLCCVNEINFPMRDYIFIYFFKIWKYY